MFSTPNYFNWAFQAITNLLNANTSVFVSMGQNLFRALATIMIAWFGIKTALSSGDHWGGIHMSQFASLVLNISFGFAMINYYATPIPGIGTDFHHLVTDQAQSLSNTLSQNMLDTVVNRISAFEGTVESPGTTMQVAVYFDYWTIIILLAIAQAVAMVVIAFGIIAMAVCVLLGPVFIPFFIVPQLDWLFWGWFKCFIQYSFYQVVAAAVVYIIGNILTSFLTFYNGQPMTIDRQGALIAPLFIVTIASVYALLKVPVLTSHIFSGAAGLSSSGIAERAFK
jgi:type IV secretory pathway VirB6-like protein